MSGFLHVDRYSGINPSGHPGNLVDGLSYGFNSVARVARSKADSAGVGEFGDFPDSIVMPNTIANVPYSAEEVYDLFLNN